MALLKEINVLPTITSAGYLPDGGMKTSQFTTLFDGKILGADDPDFWQNVGTGTVTAIPSNQNLVDLSVTSGQWIVSQTTRRMPYFSGKPQVIEVTCSDFDTEANVIKRIGYFSSNAVSPYDSAYDGFYWEDNGTTKFFKVDNLGTNKISIPVASWDNNAIWSNYDFQKFTVLQAYFLWLGGAAVIAFGAYDNNGFLLQTSVSYVGGSSADPICASPNQPLRYEIRSSTGTGNLRRICSQVASAGSIAEPGKSAAVYNSASIACNAIGTIYALKAVRKRTDRRDVSIKINEVSVASHGTADAGVLLLLKNPTISAPLSYSNNRNFQEATATTETISNVGTVLHAVACGMEGVSSKLAEDYLTWLTMGIDNTADQFVLAFLSHTANQARFGVIHILEYI